MLATRCDNEGASLYAFWSSLALLSSDGMVEWEGVGKKYVEDEVCHIEVGDVENSQLEAVE